MPPSADELFKEREKRVRDVVSMKIPDRVPVVTGVGYFPAKYCGIPASTAWTDYDKWLDAYQKTVQYLQPDMILVQGFTPGKVLEQLDVKQMNWPGHGISIYHSHQAIERENMKASEYDYYLEDPTDFVLRVLLPRTCGVLEPFQELPRLSSMGYGYQSALTLGDALNRPDVEKAIDTLKQAAREMAEWRPRIAAFNGEVKKLGFPVIDGGGAGAPFDQISDFLRGMEGAMLDLFRQPDKLMTVCDRLLQNSLDNAIPALKNTPAQWVFMALHRGSDGFMSLKQFEKFYWPGLKKVIIAVVEQGKTPCIFFEGNWTRRLEYLLELPKAKIMGQFDSTDLFKAKEVLKGHLCIRGGVPLSILQTGSVEDIKELSRKLIDVIGKDGGFILAPSGAPDEAKPENFKALVDTAKEYGVYR